MTKPPKRAKAKQAAPKKRAAKAATTRPKTVRKAGAEPKQGPGKGPGKSPEKSLAKGLGKKRVAKAGRASGGAGPIDLSGATAGVLDRLFDVVTSRRDADPNISHSARLLSRGTAKVAQKFGEEAVECLIEAVSGNSAGLIGESADVLYHLIVLWVDAGLHPAEVWSELQRREGTSGIAEKASRPAAAASIRIGD